MWYFIIGLIISIIFGFVCKAIASSRGMEGGFWWGFFLSVIGIVVVAVRPNEQASDRSRSTARTSSSFDPDSYVPLGGWRCKNCGKPHYAYQSVCSCGATKEESTEKKEEKKTAVLSESEVLAYLKEYKELLSAGIISEEEFEKKKAQLLSNKPTESPMKPGPGAATESGDPSIIRLLPTDRDGFGACSKCGEIQRNDRKKCWGCGVAFTIDAAKNE